MTAVLPIAAPARESGRPASAHALVAFSALALLVVAFLSLSVGPTGITLASLPRVLGAIITGQHDATSAREQLVLLDIRLPRLLLGAFVGAALAVSGALMQGMFRNPLADPGLVGVSSGAALAAVATIALGNGLAASSPRPSVSMPCPSRPSPAVWRPPWPWLESSDATASSPSARCCWPASPSAPCAAP
jgi:ABC-type Fe3+-siderophore transport system permease subunit